jgi:hypothetical protein
MVLADAQTVTGAKTFANGAMKLRNVAGTFSVTFSNTATANRTVTIPDANFTVARIDAAQTFTGTQTFDSVISVGTASASSGLIVLYNDNNAFGVTIAANVTADRNFYLPDASGEAVVDTAIQNLTNKRVTPRILTVASSATPAINTDNGDVAVIESLATNITSLTTNLTGAPTDGQRLILRIKDNGSARTISHGASFANRGATMLSTTTAGKWSYEIFVYNSTAAVWDCVGVLTEDAVLQNLGTGDSPQFAGVNVGHASDTTITRASAGVIAVEGVNVLMEGSNLGATTTVDGTNLVGYRGAPQNSQTASYTLVIGDAGKCIFHPSSDNNARTFTIPANGTVAFPVGTIIEFINMAATASTIAITTDTMTLLPAGTTGSRTLAQYGRASAEKISSTAWIISGNSALT